MKKREQGVLTIEASIVLTLCVIFILFLFSFSRVYSAQSLVSHAILQTSDAVALESYLREETRTGSEEDVVTLANRFMGTASISADSFTSLRSADVARIAKDKFVYAIASNASEADEKLKNLGVKDGLSGVDFSQSKIDLGNDDVIINATYTIQMQFSIFGMSEITVTKVAKSKTFGDILFGIETIPENPIMGSASGGGNYKHGTQIQISATPNYGYKFKQWSDGNTDNPRNVTVNGACTYVAQFEQSEYGINIVASPELGGSGTGAGVYKYLDTATINAVPAVGYHFTKWTIFGHNDNITKVVNSQTTDLKVDQTYSCTAHFEKNSYKINVETSGTTSGSAFIVYDNKNSTSMTLPYQTGVKLSAPTISHYKFVGWKEKGSQGYFSTSANVYVNVPAKDVTYVACYESTLRTVTFLNYDGNAVATRQVYEGESLGANMPSNPYYSGYVFNGWRGFSPTTIVYSDMTVYSNWYKCTGHKWGNCGVKHYLGGTYWWSATNIHYGAGAGHYVSWASCTRCIYCKALGTRRVLCGTHWENIGQRGWASFPYVGPNDCGAYNLP